MKDLARAKYSSVGRCIYCGTTANLRREHTIPYALGGKAFLPKASCGRCADITQRFEQAVMRGPMWGVRAYLSLQSRTKHAEAPRTVQLQITRVGRKHLVSVPLEEAPNFLAFPTFEAPGFLAPDSYTNGIRLGGAVFIVFGSHPNEVAAKLKGTGLSVTQTYDMPAFARMIAKIAYAHAVGEGETKHLAGEPFVLPAIRGERDDIGRWVGTVADELQMREGLLHRLATIKDRGKRLLLAEVQLFANSGAPTYEVILGRLGEVY